MKTIYKLIIVSLFIFGLGNTFAQNAPGGVSSGLLMWHKADDGINTIPGAKAQWNDVSGNGRHVVQATSTKQPLFVTDAYYSADSKQYFFNFNPFYYFNGTSQFFERSGAIGSYFSGSTKAGSVYGIMYNSNATGWRTAYGWGDDTPNLARYGETYEFWGNGAFQLGTGNIGLTNTPAHIGSMIWKGTGVANNGLYLNINGRVFERASSNIGTISDNLFRIGSEGYSIGYEYMQGGIPEVFAYDVDHQNNFTNNEKLRINSYLAVKYGITLVNEAGTSTSDYLASNSDNIWDATANTEYNNNVFGIAREDISELYQKQSKSANNGQKLIIGAGPSLMDTNAANTNTMSNGQYLIVGDNGLAQTLSVPLSHSNMNFRFAAVWKQQNTGGVGTVTVAWPKGIENLYLIQSTDKIFDGSDSFTPMTSVVTINGVEYNTATTTLSDGEYFTFGGFLYAPGGVLPAAWYRADAMQDVFTDAGVTPATDGQTLQQWNEFNGNGFDLLQSTAIYRPVFSNTTTLANFNPTVTFKPGSSNNYMEFTPAPDQGVIDRVNGTMYAAGYFSDVTGAGIFGFDGSMDYPGLHTSTTTPKKLLFFSASSGYNTLSSNILESNSYFISGANWQNGAGVNGSYASSSVSLNGYKTKYNTNTLYNINVATTRSLRVGGDTNWGYIQNSQLNEMIVFEEALNDNEMARVETYLSVKNGTTLADGTMDYLSSGSAIVWDKTANADYNHNIFGIARENVSALYQKQSHSTNPGQKLIIGAGSAGLTDTNAANSNTLSNGQYLIAGDNGLAQTLSVPLSHGDMNYRFEAVWKPQNTNGVGTITVAWPKGIENLYLIKSTDPMFASSNSYTPMTSVVTINGVEYNTATTTFSNGEYFTFGGSLYAPGGVLPAAWYRADAMQDVFTDAGVTPATDGQTLQQWNEFNGNGFDLLQSTAIYRPVFSNTTTLANFNPTVTFKPGSSNNYMEFTPAPDQGVIDRVNGTMYAAGYFSAVTGAGIFGFDGSMDYPGLHTSTGTPKKLLFYSASSGYSTLSDNVLEDGSYFISGANWQNGAGVNSTYASSSVSLDGYKTQYNTNTLSNINVTGTRSLRVGGDTNWGYIQNSQVNEMIVFEEALNDNEMARVETYLSVKNGTTLADGTMDYLSSESDIVWDKTANADYNHNIFGIARENVSALYQKQSHSTNPGQKLIIGAGSAGLTETNAANTNTLSNGQYLIAGDNGLAQTPSVPLAYNGSNGEMNFRFEAVWKPQNTNGVGTITVAWPKEIKNLYLIKSTDPMFASSNSYTPMTSLVTINGVEYNTATTTFSNGEYFTFGGFVYAPGGVVPTAWYRADAVLDIFTDEAGTNNATDNEKVGRWNEFNGNPFPITQTTTGRMPLFSSSTTMTNYNPTVYFETDMFLAYIPANNGNLEIIDRSRGALFSAGKATSLTSSILGFGSLYGSRYTMDDPGLYKASGLFMFYPTNNLSYSNNAGAFPSNGYYVGGGTWQNGETANTNSVLMTLLGSHFDYSNAANVLVDATRNIFAVGHDSNFSGSNEGLFNESIVFADRLNDTEVNRVESYLAIKYGNTLSRANNRNYLDADENIVWDGTANLDYYYNVFGVAREDIGAFHQKVSKSVNDGTILTIATNDDFTSSNLGAARTGFANDKTYFLLGDNNNVDTSVDDMTISGDNYKRIKRIWLSQRQNTPGDLYFQADLTTYGIEFNSIYDVVMLVADDEDFSVNLKTVDGAIVSGKWVYDYNFNSDDQIQYITFARTTSTPPVIDYCYKPGITTGGAELETKVGISALGREAINNPDNWPMVRKGGWIALESKTKGFVPNRMVFNGVGNPVGIAPADFVEGMMVYDTTNKCMKVYTLKDGDSEMKWHCMSTQTCPDSTSTPKTKLRFGYWWTYAIGTNHDNFKNQLKNPANYGPLGTFKGIEPIVDADFTNLSFTLDGLTVQDLIDNFDIIATGYSNGLSAANATKLKAFTDAGGVLIMLGDGLGVGNTLNTAFGGTGNFSQPSYDHMGAYPASARTLNHAINNGIFGDARSITITGAAGQAAPPVGNIPAGATIISYLNYSGPNTYPLTVSTTAQEYAGVFLTGTNGRAIFVFDEGIFRATGVSGTDVNTDQEKFIHNLFAYALEKAGFSPN